MPDFGWIVIPRFDEHQHPDVARTQVPAWLKTFTRLLSDDAYRSLTWEQRGLLHGIWLEYGRSRRQLRASTTSLSRQLGLTVRASQLEALNHAGFITFSASRTASTPARPEKRREERPTRTRESKTKTTATTCPICTVECRRDWKLEEHLEHVHSLQGDHLERALAAARQGRA